MYMPGFNATVKDGITVCGQLLCLADFPPHLKAFMYSWPGGRELTYFTAINYSRSARNQADFAAFFASLIEAGVKEFHILAHSVGAHVLFSALHLIAPMLQTVDQQQQQRRCDGGAALSAAVEAGEIPSARLATCLIMSPDYPLNRFVRHDFNVLRSLCSCITLYCDVSDRALTYSEIFNREKALGKNPFSLVRAEKRNGDDGVRRARSVGPPPDLRTTTTLTGGSGGKRRRRGRRCRQRCRRRCRRRERPAAPRSRSSSSRGHHHAADVEQGRPPRLSSVRSPLMERQGVLSWVVSLGERMGDRVPSMFRQSALETDLTARVMHKGLPLDMDVIDTSWMDSNVQALRHNYFNVNRAMIDDIRDVISTKRRAHLRGGRLTHRRGNVWSFLGAPKYIVNA